MVDALQLGATEKCKHSPSSPEFFNVNRLCLQAFLNSSRNVLGGDI